ncbi:MAG: NTP transferase domain-containing protein [Bacilli bacterium]|nr:NTP transferase domain-containing protein [Bacilli bacterium]
MKKDITLVIMAAGMGSRFGGLKQIEPMGPNGEFLIDYSIFDAIRAGFTKVVFIIKKENYEVFKETIGARVEPHVKVEYAFQEMDKIPEGVEIPEERVKPWGTAHALYCAEEFVNEPFAVISADDFYGDEAFKILADSLQNTEDNVVIGYKIGQTMSEEGSVKRGVCFETNGVIDKIVESKIEKVDGVIHGYPLNGDPEYTMSEDHPVSMLMYGLQEEVIDFLNEDIKVFFEENKDNLEKGEYLLPDVLEKIKAGGKELKLIPTSQRWMGVTYKEDTEKVQTKIKEFIKDGIYPNNLWEE